MQKITVSLLMAAMTMAGMANLHAYQIHLTPPAKELRTAEIADEHSKGKNNLEGQRSLWKKAIDKVVSKKEKAVHELLTCLSFYPHANEFDQCVNINDKTKPQPREVMGYLRGAEWNDDPSFIPLDSSYGFCDVGVKTHYMSKPACWTTLMARGSMSAKKIQNDSSYESQYPILVQSHFGSFQFLHSMSPDGQTAQQTLDRILGWAELAYRVGALDEFGPQTNLNQTGIPVLVQLANRLTPQGSNKYQLSYLFDVSSDAHRMRRIAFGSLLHMVQDSFAPCHTERDAKEPGTIHAFYSYLHQDGDKHGAQDATQTWDATRLTREVNPITIGNHLVEFKNKKTEWNEVKTFLSKYFELSNPDALTKPGSATCLP